MQDEHRVDDKSLVALKANNGTGDKYKNSMFLIIFF